MTRTRFAPSPTGHLHIGGLRTALYQYLWAKKNHGQFILRIEDTDKTREVPGAVDEICNVLEFFGILPDESIRAGGEYGPYIQSLRLDIYHKHIQQLLDQGDAYYCFSTEEELEEHRKKSEEAGIVVAFRSPYRDMTLDEAREKITEGQKYTIRLKVPKGETVHFVDRLRGKISVPTADIDDQVLIKSDGYPTYHFAAVVDDHLMQVTHVIRADEWLASTPKHVMLYRMFGWEAPDFIHLTAILGADRKKLSKRNGDVHVTAFLEKGYLKEAILNYIALIGWNPKTTQELFTLPQMVEAFSLEGLQIANGIWDPEKLKWMNGKYIASMPIDALYGLLESYLKMYTPTFYEGTFTSFEQSYNAAILSELQKRLETLADFETSAEFFYHEPEVDTALLLSEKMGVVDLKQAKEALEFGLAILAPFLKGVPRYEAGDFVSENPQSGEGSSSPDTRDEVHSSLPFKKELPLREILKNLMIPKIAEMGKKNGQILWPLRVALTGKEHSPGAFEMVEILGLEKAIERITKVITRLGD